MNMLNLEVLQTLENKIDNLSMFVSSGDTHILNGFSETKLDKSFKFLGCNMPNLQIKARRGKCSWCGTITQKLFYACETCDRTCCSLVCFVQSEYDEMHLPEEKKLKIFAIWKRKYPNNKEQWPDQN